MAVYNTAYKSGTIGSFSGTTVTASGFTPAAGDVGRILILNSGNGKFQHREITGVSGQDITIAHAWNTNPFVDPSSNSRATDVNPSNGDTIVVSYDLADLIAGDAQLTLTDENHVLVSGTLEASNGAYIHAKNFHFEWNSNEIDIGRDGGMIFGYYGYVAGEDGYTKDSCNIVDNLDSLGGNSIRKGTADFGLFDVYGGSYSSSQASGCFLRGYENSFEPTLSQVRMIDMTKNGNVGGRYDGNRSMLIIRGVNGRTSVGIANPTSEVARVELSATDCDQAGYGNVSFAPSGAFVFPQLRDVAVKGIRFSGVGSTVGVYTAIAKKSEIDLIDPLATVDNASPNTTFRYGNLVTPTFIDSAGATLTGTLVTRLYDDTNTLVNSEDVTGGAYTEFFARHTDISLATTGDKNLSDGTQYAPYTLRGVQYGKQFGLTNISAEDVFNPSIVYLDDAIITESTQATVDAYTELETPQKFYDRAVSWLESNITNEQSFLVSRSGDAIDAGSYNVIIDATAGSAFAVAGSTITIKANTFIGDVTTTGTITFSNGAIGVGTFTDTTGTSTAISATLNNLTTATVEIFDNTGTSVERVTNQTGSYTYYTPLGSTGTWTYVVDRVGYNRLRGSFNPAGSNIEVDGAINQLVTANGSAMYTGSSSSLITVAFDFGTPCMCIEIGDSAVDPQTVFDEAEDALLTVDGMKWQNTYGSLVRYDDLPGVGKILFLEEYLRIKRASAGDVNSAVSGYLLSVDGTPIDGANGSVGYVGGFNVDDVWNASTRTLTAGTKDSEIDSILTDTGTTIPNQITALNDLSTAQVQAELVTYGANTTTPNTIAPDNAGITANGVAIGNLNNFDPTSETVTTDTASRDASKATGFAVVGDIPTVEEIDAEITLNHGSGSYETATATIPLG